MVLKRKGKSSGSCARKASPCTKTTKPTQIRSHTDNAIVSQMVQKRAYFIWEERGKPHGSDVDIWIQAERDILSHVKK